MLAYLLISNESNFVVALLEQTVTSLCSVLSHLQRACYPAS